eukprot:15334989-Ditylum_brightwellii.AAC.1
MGQWYNYFLEWDEQNDGKTIREVVDSARKGKWNIDSILNRITKYKIAHNIIKLTRTNAKNNDGWDTHHLLEHVHNISTIQLVATL